MNPRCRFQMANGVYHITNRGVDRRPIVTDDDDRRKWLHCLGDAAIQCGWRVYAYALLTNHFHLFLRTPEPNLSAGMQELEGRYAKFFNRREDRSGHLFEDRFHAILVEQDGHCWELSRYLHLNAVRARLAAHPDTYPWSSFPAYMNSRLAPRWLDWRTVLGEVARTESAARVGYRRFVEAGLRSPPSSPFDRVVADSFLGSDAFVQQMIDRFGDGRQHLPSAERRPHCNLTPETIVREVAAAMQTTADGDLPCRTPPASRAGDRRLVLPRLDRRFARSVGQSLRQCRSQYDYGNGAAVFGAIGTRVGVSGVGPVGARANDQANRQRRRFDPQVAELRSVLQISLLAAN